MRLACSQCGKDMEFDVHHMGFDLTLKFDPCECALIDAPNCNNCTNLTDLQEEIRVLTDTINRVKGAIE